MYSQYPPNTGDFHYQLEVVQQPIRARMCGFGDKDRRQITPPPCVRLRIYNRITAQEITDISSIDTSHFAVLVELWSSDGTTNVSLVNGYPQGTGGHTRNLIGSLAATAFKLHDLEDQLGIWFVLQDLSVRTEGEFRLKFSFVNLADIKQSGTPIVSWILSESFRSYSAKKFPGVIDSTDLSKCFATQGIKIPIRRENKHSKEK